VGQRREERGLKGRRRRTRETAASREKRRVPKRSMKGSLRRKMIGVSSTSLSIGTRPVTVGFEKRRKERDGKRFVRQAEMGNLGALRT